MNDTALDRGFRTAIQFVIGLFGAVVAVPGVLEAVQGYLLGLGAIGAFLAGLVAFLYNFFFRKDIRNY